MGNSEQEIAVFWWHICISIYRLITIDLHGIVIRDAFCVCMPCMWVLAIATRKVAAEIASPPVSLFLSVIHLASVFALVSYLLVRFCIWIYGTLANHDNQFSFVLVSNWFECMRMLRVAQLKYAHLLFFRWAVVPLHGLSRESQFIAHFIRDVVCLRNDRCRARNTQRCLYVKTVTN